MRKIQNEIKIGLTIVIAMLIAVIGFRLMQDVPIFRPSLQVHTAFERVDGISPGSSVFMSGVKIGAVNRVTLAGPDSVEVVMNISDTDVISVGSKAVIESADLIGSKRIRIEDSGRPEIIRDGGYIEGHYEIGAMDQLEDMAEDLQPDVKQSAENLGQVLQQVNELLREGGKEDLQQSLTALRGSSQEINNLIQQRSEDLGQSIQSLQQFMANLDTLSSGRQSQLDGILENLESTSRELGVISGELGGVSSELHLMMQEINTGEGTIGRMIQDPSLYENLDSLAVNLKDATKKLNEDPSHFLKHMRLVDIF